MVVETVVGGQGDDRIRQSALPLRRLKLLRSRDGESSRLFDAIQPRNGKQETERRPLRKRQCHLRLGSKTSIKYQNGSLGGPVYGWPMNFACLARVLHIIALTRTLRAAVRNMKTDANSSKAFQQVSRPPVRPFEKKLHSFSFYPVVRAQNEAGQNNCRRNGRSRALLRTCGKAGLVLQRTGSAGKD